MAEKNRGRSGAAPTPTYYGFPTDSLYDSSSLPDFDTTFISPEDVEAFVQALAAPDPLQSPAAPSAPLLADEASAAADGDTAAAAIAAAAAASDPLARRPSATSSLFITAKNDWAPVYEKVARSGDEGRAGSSPVNNGSGTAPSSGVHTAPHFFSSSWLPELPSWRRRQGSSGSATTNSAASTASTASISPSTKRWRRQQPSQEKRRRAAAASAAAGKRARAKPGPSSGRRTQDETREGYLYGLLKWPFLLGVFGWIIGLSVAYLLTRMYIAAYEQLVTWRGRRKHLRSRMRAASNYADWVAAAKDLDAYLGNDRWKEENEFAFYDFRTVRRVADQLRKCRERAGTEEDHGVSMAPPAAGSNNDKKAVSDLKALVEACVKNNFAGVENRHLYSRTYNGTKNLVQSFVNEVETSLQFLIDTNQLDAGEKRALFKRLYANYGRTALCLSGGASFAYYHFGVVKALLSQDLLPDVITGTSGGALVAALVATRTDDELQQLLVPALAKNINACSEPLRVWLARWWRTGARFDAVEWSRRCSWWTRGSMTFREAYERTGRILNVTCVPADPHSPTILCNYRTAPDCVIWSAVLASAAVPGILNPVVLMMKTPGGRLVPFSFGHKWKDGSLRTDIPIKALNLHFNVNFTIVSQVNPHVNLFFFSSRGSVGQPVTHRKGRGWRGGYLGSAFEEYLKQDLRKWLKLLRNLELLPRPLGQDWSQLWLQPFSGTITIWPKSVPMDFVHILADPDPPRLARMLHEGQQSAFPPLKFVSNRLRVERLVERGRRESRMAVVAAGAGAGPGAVESTRAATNSSSRHAASSSIESLPSDEEPAATGRGLRHVRGLHSLRTRIGGGNLVGLGLGGLGSTTATSDENLSSDSELDDILSGNGGGGGGDGNPSRVPRGTEDDAADDETPVLEGTEADDG